MGKVAGAAVVFAVATLVSGAEQTTAHLYCFCVVSWMFKPVSVLVPSVLVFRPCLCRLSSPFCSTHTSFLPMTSSSVIRSNFASLTLASRPYSLNAPPPVSSRTYTSAGSLHVAKSAACDDSSGRVAAASCCSLNRLTRFDGGNAVTPPLPISFLLYTTKLVAASRCSRDLHPMHVRASRDFAVPNEK